MSLQQSHRQNLEGIERPPTTEKYWQLGADISPSLGAQVVRLPVEKIRDYVSWVRRTEEAYEQGLGLVDESTVVLQALGKPVAWHEQQLHISPKNEIDINLVDFNTAALYVANDTVLSSPISTKGLRRADATRAYATMGALNYAPDYGLYIAALLPNVMMHSPPEGYISPENGFSNYSIDLLSSLVGDIDDLQDKDRISNKIKYLKGEARAAQYQPGRLNNSISMLIELGAYFADFCDDYGGAENDFSAYQLEDRTGLVSESALGLARYFLDDSSLSSFHYQNKESNSVIQSQLRRRKHDVDFLDVYRKAKHNFLTPAESERQFVELQKEYIKDYINWMKENPVAEGTAFEWLTVLALNNLVYRRGWVGEAYAMYGAPRADMPEDNLTGKDGSRRHSIDVFFKHGQDMFFYQCKLSSDSSYADPPIVVVSAREMLAEHCEYPKWMDRFTCLAENLLKQYESLDYSGDNSFREFQQRVENKLLADAA